MNKLESMGEVAQAILSDEEKEAVQAYFEKHPEDDIFNIVTTKYGVAICIYREQISLYKDGKLRGLSPLDSHDAEFFNYWNTEEPWVDGKLIIGVPRIDLMKK